jgi:hypothetical protein
MGSYDGAEVCELVGLYILNNIPIISKQNVGLYRDDGLAVIHNTSPSEKERIKKKLCAIFNKEFDLKITADANMNVVNFLDITFNLQQSTFKPYRKPGDIPVYVHVDSNHPPTVTRQVPISICNRISNLSDSEESFKNTIPLYEKALKESGYKHKCTYNQNNPPNPRNRTRKRKNIIWFNPPFSKNVVTNVGREFFKILDRHFPRNSPLNKIFNRNTVKLSYSCMDNIATIINTHNKKILNQANAATTDKTCNCPKSAKDTCPLDGQCCTKNIIYKATITPESSPPKYYIGLTSTTFKERLGNHTASFKHKIKSNSTELSKFVWSLKQQNINYDIKWSIIQRASPYNPATKRCNLCLAEKYHILTASSHNTLNKRSELISNCRHRNKHKLNAFSTS